MHFVQNNWKILPTAEVPKFSNCHPLYSDEIKGNNNNNYYYKSTDYTDASLNLQGHFTYSIFLFLYFSFSFLFFMGFVPAIELK